MVLIDNTFKINIHFTRKRKELKKYIDFNLKNYEGICIDNGSDIYVGVFSKKRSVLCHELFHCIIFLNNRIGSNVNIETQEFNSYYMEKLFDIIDTKYF